VRTEYLREKPGELLVPVAPLEFRKEKAALLRGACPAHDLAPVNRLLPARGCSGLPVRAQLGRGEWPRVLAVSIQRQKEGGPLLHDPHAGVSMPVDAPLVTFGIPEPAFQIEVVLGKVQEVASGKQARRETSHHPPYVLAEGIPIPQESALDLVERRAAIF
jgi:hypothetical protein